MVEDLDDAFKEFERAGWEEVASGYAEFYEPIVAELTAAVLDAAEAGPGVRVLDVASGPGWVTGGAADRGADAVGLDFAVSMVEQARRRYPEVEFRQGEAENLPFDDESFDVVTSSLGMPHFADHDAFMSEAARVLRPGGRLVFASWVRPANNPFLGVVLAAIAKHGSLEVELPPGIDMFTWDDLAACQEYLDRAGFGPAERTDAVLSIELDNGPVDVLRTLEEASVRSRALLMAQTPEARAAIEAELEVLMQPHKVGDQWVLEGRVFVVAANKTSPSGD